MSTINQMTYLIISALLLMSLYTTSVEKSANMNKFHKNEVRQWRQERAYQQFISY